MRWLPWLSCFVLSSFLFAQDLQDPDPKQRARAARDLADRGVPALPQLQGLLSDPEVDVRLEAVKSIVAIGTQHSLDPLIQATRDNDPEIQIRATDGLVNFYLPGYVKTGLTASLRRAGTAVKSRFTDTNDQIIEAFIQPRAEIIEALGKLARGASSMDARANAARAVGILRGRAAVPDLVAALRSKDDRVIYESLIALQKIRDPEAAPQITFLLKDFHEPVQLAAIETTGLLQNKAALGDLKEVLSRNRSKKVNRAALTAIAMLPDEGSRPLYLKYLNDKDDGMRAAAAEGLGRLKNPADLPVIEKAFNEERKNNARLSLAFAMVMLGKTETTEFSPLQYLINTLNSTSYRGVARPFLVELSRDTGIRQALYPAARTGTKDEKMEIAQILARSGQKDSLPVLENLSRDSDPEVAQEGLRALRSLKARLP
ncbi:MAG: HEAT repeat domain-containing protein [Bryobacteraceae bacterium]|nr:HEAT repeat domain-containing protein [Bryobacterales bacterium]MEB2360869.1 HEAT repeat domain-containing protein [Bryobacterales bacterium]NUN02257.1 HEAT repeat domain-containing protein [Bryobacteraceae bacterium]